MPDKDGTFGGIRWEKRLEGDNPAGPYVIHALAPANMPQRKFVRAMERIMKFASRQQDVMGVLLSTVS